MKRAPSGQGVAVLLGLVVGCAAPPPESDRIAESIVITKNAPKVNFSEYKTFYIRPEIRTLDDEGDLAPVDPSTAQPLLNTTEKNLTARGFEEAASPDKADLGVELVYIEHVTTSYWCYSWWDPYYWGYPTWGYYPYYGGCDTATWRSGMLATMIVDLAEASEDGSGGEAGTSSAGGAGGRPPLSLAGIWFSGVYSVSPSSSKAVDGINQAFKQSPYIAAAK